MRVTTIILFAALGIASTAHASATAVQRITAIDIFGTGELDRFEDFDGTLEFGSFANSLHNKLRDDDGKLAESSAFQNSFAGVNAAGALLGGFAEGDATAEAIMKTAEADSRYIVRFDVVGNPVKFHLGGSIGADFFSHATAQLTDFPGDVGDQFFFLRKAGRGDGESAVFDTDLLLQPGRYQLFLEIVASADGHGEAAFLEHSGFFNVSFSVGNPSVVPLPSTLYTGGLGLLLAAGATAKKRLCR